MLTPLQMEISIIASVTVFLALALFWYMTGRFFLIGLLVKIAWVPINLLYGLLWIFALFANSLIGFIRNSRLYPFIICGLLFWIFYYSEDERMLVFTVSMSIAISIIFKIGFNEAALKSAANYIPQPRKIYISPPKKTKLQKEFEKEQNEKHLPPPIVEIIAKRRGKFETIEQIKRRKENEKLVS